MLSGEKLDVLTKYCAPFKFGRLQELAQLANKLSVEGVSLEDFEEFIHLKRMEKLKDSEEFNRRMKNKIKSFKRQWQKQGRQCPKCGALLELRRIVAPKGKANVKGYQSHWYCKTEDCLFEEYSFKTVEHHLKALKVLR